MPLPPRVRACADVRAARASGTSVGMNQQYREPLPSHYNDLDGSLAEAWRLLVRGAADRKSPMHTPSVATIGIDGFPQVRTVVLRHADASNRTLRFHTDKRSNKFRELSADPRIQLLTYDAGNKIQLRVSGRAALHSGDTIATQAWQRSQTMSQQCYRQALNPGAISADPIAALAPGDHDGQANFVAVMMSVDAIEWLYLAHGGHRRARFAWGTDGAVASQWLAP